MTLRPARPRRSHHDSHCVIWVRFSPRRPLRVLSLLSARSASPPLPSPHLRTHPSSPGLFTSSRPLTVDRMTLSLISILLLSFSVHVVSRYLLRWLLKAVCNHSAFVHSLTWLQTIPPNTPTGQNVTYISGRRSRCSRAAVSAVWRPAVNRPSPHPTRPASMQMGTGHVPRAPLPALLRPDPFRHWLDGANTGRRTLQTPTRKRSSADSGLLTPAPPRLDSRRGS